MLSQLLATGHQYILDPETDAPPAGQLTNYNQKDLFLAAFVVPVVICLVVHWTSAFIGCTNSKLTSNSTAPGNRKQASPTLDSGIRRHRQSRPRSAAAAVHQQLRVSHQPYQQYQQLYSSPPPLQTYHQLQQQHHWDSTAAGCRMDPPQQQFTSPQTERPFRRTQARARPPSPQSERPFRVIQSQRVYSTPGSEDRPAGPAPPAARPQSQSPASQTNRPFRSSRAQAATPYSNSTQAGRVSASPQTDAPFRFRDSPELEQQQQQQQRQLHLSNGTPEHGAAAGNGVPMLFTSPSQQQTRTRPSPQQQSQQHGWQQSQPVQMQQQRRSPVWGMPQRPAAAHADEDGDESDEYDDEEIETEELASPQHTTNSGWDPSLLRQCAQQESLIASVQGLKQSKEYRNHITQARHRNMTLELKEDNKLRVYKALRSVDPDSFRQLFSRRDVLEYDEVPLSSTLAVCECLLASALTFTLLGLPIWLPAWTPLQTVLAVLWALQQLWAVASGCTSLFARMLNIYSTQGVYSMLPSWWGLLAAVALDALLVVLLPGVGLLASLSCRLLTQQHQSCGERLLRLQPMREVVRPMRFSPYSPGALVTGIETDEERE